MLDIKLLREQPDLVKQALRNRNDDPESVDRSRDHAECHEHRSRGARKQRDPDQPCGVRDAAYRHHLGRSAAVDQASLDRA